MLTFAAARFFASLSAFASAFASFLRVSCSSFWAATRERAPAFEESASGRNEQGRRVEIEDARTGEQYTKRKLCK
jgi:hypothetical protein